MLAQNYVDAMNSTPVAKQILKTKSGGLTDLIVQIQEGKEPFVYARAYASEVVGNEGWFLRDQDDPRSTGYKCILMSRARRNAALWFPSEFTLGIIPVASLQVIKVSESGQSLLCEVHKFFTDDQTKLQDVVPMGFEGNEAECIQKLKDSGWTIGKHINDISTGRVLLNCVDPNGTVCHLAL